MTVRLFSRLALCLGAAVFLVAGSLVSGIAAAGESGSAPVQPSRETVRDREHFEQKIRPVLIEHCYRCHSAMSQPPKGGLRLDTAAALRAGGDSGPAIVPGQPAESLLLDALQFDGLQMPPDRRLPVQVVADFTRWIERGAFDPRTDVRRPVVAEKPNGPTAAHSHWAWQPLAKVAPPAIEQPERASRPLDRFLLARLDTAQLEQAPRAALHVLLRRLYFDLHGLPPAAEDYERLAQAAESHAGGTDEVLKQEVDRLLASPRFGERWGRHWLDLARFAESNGGDRNVIWPHAWRYRDYVVEAQNSDRPWIQFLQEQLAGDLLPYDSWQQRDRQRVATGFLTLGPKLFMEPVAEQFQLDVIDEQIEVTGRAMLGLTLSCARCHDHKFDPVSARDYYALAGIFGSTQLLYGTAAPAGNQYGHDRPLQPIGERGEELQGPALAWQQQVVEQTAARNKARSDRYRVVRKKAALENELKQTEGNSARQAELKAEIEPLEQSIKEWDEKIRLLDEKLKHTEDNPPPLPDYAMAVCDQPAAKVQDQAVRIRGVRTQKGKTVPRGVPQLFAGNLLAASESDIIPAGASGRRELAEWLAGPAAPLVARVTVNRVWQHLFGEGLVRTVDNFGRMGESPSHPELLDWLAGEFIRRDWSLKWLVREIVLSRSWQASSRFDAVAADVDPENRLLWRMPVRRLDAEPLRDAMLAIAGQLSTGRPAASVVGELEGNELNDRIRLTPEQLNQPLRSLYLPLARLSLPEQLELFDFADPSLSIGQRGERILPAQRLFLFNSEVTHDLAEKASRRLLEETPEDPALRLELMWLRFFGRRPDSAEREIALAAVEQAAARLADEVPEAERQQRAWALLCQALFAAGEFQTLE